MKFNLNRICGLLRLFVPRSDGKRGFLAGIALLAAGVLPAASSKPNIIFVLADDLGWTDIGPYGSDFIETPHLDDMAAEGMRFTNAYAAAPVCSPFRASFLTGQHPARVGILDYLRPASVNALSTDHVTLPEMLKKKGYATGMVGKWHLTGYEYHDAEYEIKPKDHGFDWDFGREIKSVGNGANFWPYKFRDQPVSWIDIKENRMGEGEYLTDRLNLEAVDFIERNKDKPFFLYLAHYAPHTILNGRPDLVEKYRKKCKPGPSDRTNCYLCQDIGLNNEEGQHWAKPHNPHLAAMVESIDDGIGLIEKKLQELGIADNTIFVFTSDNGGESNVTSNAPSRGGKSELYEGGVRIPLIVKWPGKVPAGSVSDQPNTNMDHYPSFLEAAGIKPEKDYVLDGVSILKQWMDPGVSLKREPLYWHYPLDKPHFLGGISMGSIRDGDWKLIENFDDGGLELYQLADDPSEKKDVFSEYPEKANLLLDKLKKWRKSVRAQMPSAPLLVRPWSLYFGDHFSSGRISSRWMDTKGWKLADGTLELKSKRGGKLELSDEKFKNALIRFDFRLQKANAIEISIGDNVSLSINRRGFRISADASDADCSYRFKASDWYTMTIELHEDEVVAHVDRGNHVYLRKKDLGEERTGLSLNADGTFALDNFQVFTAGKRKEYDENIKKLHGAN